MDTIKQISQNPQRYSKKVDRYQISATSSITPIDLPFGPNVEGLIPVLEVDGIIVNVGEWKLISQRTLDVIKNSDNPHYDVKDNGVVRGVKIGQTIPSITLNIQNLIGEGTNRDRLNRLAGVTDVEYVYEGNTIDGTTLSKNLIKQINYTLSQTVSRPPDTYTLTELQLSDAKYYEITNLAIVNSQDTGSGVFDYDKLKGFMDGVKERQIALQNDLNYIKRMFFNGDIPSNPTTYTLTKIATAEDNNTDGNIQVVYKRSFPSPEIQQTTRTQLSGSNAPVGGGPIGMGGTGGTVKTA